MERPAPYDIVVSLAGHDAGKLYMVTGAAEERLFLCDGKTRRMANPKCKSPKHVRIAAAGDTAPDSDRKIREMIALTAAQAAAKEVRLLGKR